MEAIRAYREIEREKGLGRRHRLWEQGAEDGEKSGIGGSILTLLQAAMLATDRIRGAQAEERAAARSDGIARAGQHKALVDAMGREPKKRFPATPKPQTVTRAPETIAAAAAVPGKPSAAPVGTGTPTRPRTMPAPDRPREAQRTMSATNPVVARLPGRALPPETVREMPKTLPPPLGPRLAPPALPGQPAHPEFYRQAGPRFLTLRRLMIAPVVLIAVAMAGRFVTSNLLESPSQSPPASPR